MIFERIPDKLTKLRFYLTDHKRFFPYRLSAVGARRCAFCNCGERSLLGQGDLNRYDPTPGFNPFRRPSTRDGNRSSTLDSDDKVARLGSTRRSRSTVKPARFVVNLVFSDDIQYFICPWKTLYLDSFLQSKSWNSHG